MKQAICFHFILVMVKKLRYLNYAFVTVMLALVLIMCWSGYTMYKMQQQRISDIVLQDIKSISTKLQEENVTTLNNLAGIIDNEDAANMMAFAAGATGNTGKMRKWFGEDTAIVQKKIEAQTKQGKPVLQINKQFIKTNNIAFNPSVVKGIYHFDSMFRVRIATQHINLRYNIHKQSPHDTVFTDAHYSYSSPGFILNFHQPKFYRLDYTIRPATILKAVMPFIAANLLALGIVIAAFVFMRRAYKTQAQMSAFKEGLFSNITHELKTPLSSLQLILETTEATGGYMPAQHQSYAQTELRRMRLIIEKILSFGRMSSEQLDLNKEVIDVNTVIQEAIDVMDINISHAEATVNFTNTAPLYIAADKLLLLNTIATIIDNAIKYNTGNVMVNITLEKKNAEVWIYIADNGIGIDPAYHKKIFDPFFRVPTGNVHNVKGHGLGLSFAMQVTNMHKGSIQVESKTGGSSFIIILPITAA